ncbi:MAG: hypothetical protein R3F60_31590 [bacterium]
MKRIGWACLLLLWLAGEAAAAVSVRVAIGDFTGRGSSPAGIEAFQSALKRLGGIGLESTSAYQDKARELGVEAALPRDVYAVIDVTAGIDVDAVLYLESRPGRGRDTDLIIQVYAGRSGSMLGEHTIRVKRGRLTSGIWKKAARSVEQDIYATLDAVAPPPRRAPPPPPVEPARRPEPTPRVRDDLDDLDDERGAGNQPMFRLAAGLSLLARTFSYTALADSPQFSDGGIQYESALVPGIVLDAEFHPFAGRAGFLGDLGLGLRYEKVFVSTEQEVELTDSRTKTQPLETSHDHVVVRGLWRHALSGDPAAIELLGGLGLGILAFAVADNDEYNGVTYTYLDLTAGVYLPLGTPLAALDVQFSVLPVVGLGDTVKELGAEASTFGWRAYLGAGSRLASGLTASAGVEYLSMAADVTGSGRGGRKGQTAEDAFLGLRLLGGYQF